MYSVILPLYNQAKYVNNAIESTISQSCRDWELIVIDDASTDGGMDRISEVYKKDERLRFVKNYKNMGVSESRNRGVALSRGEWLLFLDSDDTFLKNKILLYDNTIRSNPGVGMIYSQSYFIDETGAYIYDGQRIKMDGTGYSTIRKNYIEHVLRHDVSVPTSSVCISRDVFNRTKGFRPEYGDIEDTLLWYEIFSMTNVCFIPEVCQTYRVHEDSWNYHNQDQKHLLTRRIRLQIELLKVLEESVVNRLAHPIRRDGIRLLALAVVNYGLSTKDAERILTSLSNQYKSTTGSGGMFQLFYRLYLFYYSIRRRINTTAL